MTTRFISDNIKIFRIRRCSGYIGSWNYYHHADVIAPHWKTALKAARDGKVKNWRMIDSFDISTSDYSDFEYLYKVSWKESKIPAIPGEPTPREWFRQKDYFMAVGR